MTNFFKCLKYATWTWDYFLSGRSRLNVRRRWDLEVSDGANEKTWRMWDWCSAISIVIPGRAAGWIAGNEKGAGTVSSASDNWDGSGFSEGWVGGISVLSVFVDSMLYVGYVNRLAMWRRICGHVQVRNMCCLRQCSSPSPFQVQLKLYVPYFGGLLAKEDDVNAVK